MADAESAVMSCQALRLAPASQHLILMTRMSDPATSAPEPQPHHYIPRALLFDFEQAFCDRQSPLPHTMPSAAHFQQQARQLGIGKSSNILVYDNRGLYSAARVWWMFKAMGHDNIRILDGGLPAWLRENGPTEKTLSDSESTGDFITHARPEHFITAQQLAQHLEDPDLVLIDARSRERFNGIAPEPRAGLRSGHIPGSLNLPFSELVSQQGTLQCDNMQRLFTQHQVSKDKHLVMTCGSGVTACILALAAWQLGYRKISVYDGSWAEWGADPRRPTAVGKGYSE